jgi:hypothetical protein
MLTLPIVLASALYFALILSGILLILTPERAPRTVLRDERPENLGFYACMVTTNVGSFNFVIENFFSSLKVNSIQNGLTFGQNMVFLYRYGCTSQVRPVIAKVTL